MTSIWKKGNKEVNTYGMEEEQLIGEFVEYVRSRKLTSFDKETEIEFDGNKQGLPIATNIKRRSMMNVQECMDKAKQRYERLKNTSNKGFEAHNGELMLKKGTLIHGTKFDKEKLSSIAKKGLICKKASGFINYGSNDRFSNGVNFYRVPKDYSMKQYVEFYSNRRKTSNGKYVPITSEEEIRREDGTFSLLGRGLKRIEYNLLPQDRVSDKDGIAFIINSSPEIERIMDDDPYRNGNKEIFDDYNGFDDIYSKMKNRIGNIIYGIPPSQLSGILISKGFEENKEQIEFLKKIFPDLYISTIEGELIYEPQIEKKQEEKSQKSKIPNIHRDNEIRKSIFNPKDRLGMGNMKRNVRLGNSGEMHRYVAADGSNYLVKPAYRKHTKSVEPFRAFIQRAAYDVQKIIDPDSAVACNVKLLEIDGQEVIASVQEEIEGTNFDDLTDLPREKYQKYAPQFLREFVTDYLLGNYDSHSGNFIVDKNGVLRGIDKEQSMKYIADDRTKGIDISYAPNGPSHEPVYNKLFRMYEKGMIDFDFKEVSTYLDRIDEIPNDKYRKIFENYVKTKTDNEQEREELLNKILERKINAREHIEYFLYKIKLNRVAREQGISPEKFERKVISTAQIGKKTINSPTWKKVEANNVGVTKKISTIDKKRY